jgi:cation diffusion facilitator CzcD-associated flavoprotein CzcO
MHDVVIVGAGFSGLAMAVRLQQEGTRDFLLLERAEEVGGTWWFRRMMERFDADRYRVTAAV